MKYFSYGMYFEKNMPLLKILENKKNKNKNMILCESPLNLRKKP